jgi:uncharacterized protein (TIGR02284 family)
MAGSSNEMQGVGTAIYSVIESLIESQEALVEIGEKLADLNLKRFFLTESLKRAEFRGELESILNQEGVSALRRSHPAECAPTRLAERAVYHSTMGLRSLLRDAGEETLLATAEQGEDAAREAYDHAMSAYLPGPVREVLASQASHIQQSQNFVKAARVRAA